MHHHEHFCLMESVMYGSHVNFGKVSARQPCTQEGVIEKLCSPNPSTGIFHWSNSTRNLVTRTNFKDSHFFQRQAAAFCRVHDGNESWLVNLCPTTFQIPLVLSFPWEFCLSRISIGIISGCNCSVNVHSACIGTLAT
jgi:hypothetical protein